MRPYFYTSDTHFRHSNIIKYCNRPFSSKEEMDEELITRWNNKVPKDGLVYHVGDVILGGSAEMKEVLPRLNGEKILVIGNHDEESPLRPYFMDIFRLVSFTDPVIKRKMCLCHYPIESWPGMHRGVIHLHGHCHGTLQHKIENRMDVGVDCHPKFEPFSSEEISVFVRRGYD